MKCKDCPIEDCQLIAGKDCCFGEARCIGGGDCDTKEQCRAYRGHAVYLTKEHNPNTKACFGNWHKRDCLYDRWENDHYTCPYDTFCTAALAKVRDTVAITEEYDPNQKQCFGAEAGECVVLGSDQCPYMTICTELMEELMRMAPQTRKQVRQEMAQNVVIIHETP